MSRAPRDATTSSGTPLVEGPRQQLTAGDLVKRVFVRPKHVQLELPLEGVPSMRRVRFVNGLKAFGTSFGPSLGQKLLMRIGTPMVAATTPIAIELFAPQYRDNVVANLLVGSGLGGAWGAAIGATLPFDGSGTRISRVRSAGLGAAGGIVLAPAVAIASKLVVDWITAPIVRDRDEAEAEADAAEQEAKAAEADAARAETGG